MSNQEIKVLDDRQQSREKLPIFYGSRDNHVHGVKELIANAADELKNNDIEHKEINVKLYNDGYRIFVRDNGRGIPIDGDTNGIPNYELLFQKLFAGTKYDVTDSITTGTNGVGTCVLNYTSVYFEVRSFRNGYLHQITFENGGKLTKKLESKKLPSAMKNKTGTEITIQLDPQVYTETRFDRDVIEDIIKHFAVASLGIKYTFEYEHGEDFSHVDFMYTSYQEYFDELVAGQTTSDVFGLGSHMFEDKVIITSGEGQIEIEERNKYNLFITTMPDVIQESYLNATYLSEGGSIHDGVLDGIRLFMNKYCRDEKLFPKGITTLSKDDVNNSISFLALVESNNVEFSNQTKLSTNKDLYKNQAKEYVTSLLQAAQIEKPQEFKLLVKHLLEVQKHNSASDRARQKLKKKLTEKVEGIGNKVDKLVDCEIHGMEAELYISEGDSAQGSIIDARDDEFQATYPLRGKMLNVLKADLEKVFNNQEVVDLVKMIGTGIQDGKRGLDDFNIENARYGKIIVATDADPDGAQIAVLFLTFIYRFMKPLLEKGMIYLAQTPLYELKTDDDVVHYFLSEDDKSKNIHKFKDRKYTMTRVKGLGEQDAKTMHETAMNPETRNLVQITAKNMKQVDSMINDWMGTSVDARKEIIGSNLADYIDLSE